MAQLLTPSTTSYNTLTAEHLAHLTQIVGAGNISTTQADIVRKVIEKIEVPVESGNVI